MFRFEPFSKTMFVSTLGLSALALVLGCQGRPQAKNQAAAAKPSGTSEFGTLGAENAPGSVHQKMTFEQFPLSIEKHDTKQLLRIQKSALKKEFLLSTSMLTSGTTPNWYYFMPRIIYFEQQGEKILVRQSNDVAIYETIRLDALVETFNIVKQDDKVIVFDLGSGFANFAYEDYSATVSPEKIQLRESGKLVIDQLLKSVITHFSQAGEVIDIDETGKILETQKASTGKSAGVFGHLESTQTMNFRLRPYRKNDSFEPRLVDKSRKIDHLFTLRKVPEYESVFQKIAFRWDFSKGPVSVGIAEGFPAEHESVIIESVAYWNRLLGGEKLKILRGINSQRPPPERMILVRWIPYEDSSAAWAVMQADPRTGEILNSQISLTSSWKNIPLKQSLSVAKKSDQPTLGFFSALQICKLQIGELQFESVNLERRKSLIKDILREVTAHELGHALGLGHNFAGSFDTPENSSEVVHNIEAFYQNSLLKSFVPATTVMDYHIPAEYAMVGRFILSGELPYDRAAMRYLETGKESELATLKKTACSNSELARSSFKLYGCSMFDQGRNPILAAVTMAERNKQKTAKMIFDHIVNQIYPQDSQEVKSLDEVFNRMNSDYFKVFFEGQSTLNAVDDLHGFMIYDSTRAGFKELKTGALLYSVVDQDEWNQPNYRTIKTTEAMGGDLVAAGGLVRILKILNPLLISADGRATHFMQTQLQSLFASAEFQAGQTMGGRVYSLTSDQQESIKRFFQIKMPLIEELLLKNFNNWSPGNGLKYSALLKNDSWFVEVVKYIGELVTLNKSERIPLTLGTKTLSLPVRAISKELRESYVDFLSKNNMNANVGEIEINEIRQALKKPLLDVFSVAYEVEEPGRTKAMPKDTSEMLKEVSRLFVAGKITIEAANWMREEIAVLRVIEE